MADNVATSSSSNMPSTLNPPANRGRRKFNRNPNSRPKRESMENTESSTQESKKGTEEVPVPAKREKGGNSRGRGNFSNRNNRPRPQDNGERGENLENRPPNRNIQQPSQQSSSFNFNPHAVAFVPCCLPNAPEATPSSSRGRRGNQNNSNRGARNPRGNNSNFKPRGMNRRPRYSQDTESSFGGEKLDDRPLRERLINQLENNRYECPICYQKITTKQGVWSCKTCHHIFHISTGCIIDWAKSSRDKEDDNKWRCPTCQTKNDKMPYNYFCFCGKQRNPTYQLGETPHSCGETCGGARKNGCPHPCTEICHPGPCSGCQLQTSKSCNCGKIKKNVRCGSGDAVQCESVCEKPLSCGNHFCTQICHEGDCGECTVLVEQDCFCGLKSREVLCNPTSSQKYSCDTPCEGFFDCEVHRCNRKCHDLTNGCGECELGTNRITTCPCGKKSLSVMGKNRTKCSDPIPLCGLPCEKLLDCGSSGKPHRCQAQCHEGPCPPCQLTTAVSCRCSTSKKMIPCQEYMEILKTTGEYLCTKRCKKKKSCGMHKCQEVCCIQQDHFCMQLCNKKLSCGIHNCEHICHAGQCPKCLEACFEEKYCYCGKTVRMPPIPCGEGPPPCAEICIRPQPCGHEPNHKCHPETIACPPCIVLTEKKCYGEHISRKNIPCHISGVSCGIQCSRPLACGIHVCSRSCHGDECEKPGETCRKKCEVLREGCEHPCLLECHGTTKCQPSACRTMVRISCECGRIKKEYQCWEVDKIMAANEAKIAEENEESEVKEEKKGTLKRSSSMTQLNCLKCDDECRKLERNRKVAEVLDIEIDEFGDTKLAPMITFPAYLKDMVKTSIDFVKTVEKVYMDMLEKLNDPTKEQSIIRAHLPPMNLEKRRFIHEYAGYFKIETESVDEAPKRSIMLTATRGKSQVPFVLITELVNYKGALSTPGPAVIRKDLMDEANRNAARSSEEEGMKTLKTIERVVYRREPRPTKQLTAPPPVKQSNIFSCLRSDDEEEQDGHEEGKGHREKNASGSSSSNVTKDWWDDEPNETGEWTEVKPKEWVVEVEKEIQELVIDEKKEEPAEDWEPEQEQLETDEFQTDIQQIAPQNVDNSTEQ